jgi:glyoxylase-like metal-dependent hydrolase (beta-lactamase superfamily II)
MKTNLRLKVMTSSPEGFWANSTLIEGEKDAILIDAQFMLSDAHRVAAAILESRKNLAAIYITHFHPDHYFGLNVLKEAFPQVKMTALPSTIKNIKANWENEMKTWKPIYGDNLSSRPITPEAMIGRTLTLEGETLEIVGELQGDARDNSYVWIPSLQAVITGDIVFNGLYPWTLETTPAERKEWIHSLDKITALGPLVVVGGHKNPVMKDDLSGVWFTKSYLAHYDEALASSETAEEFRSKIKGRFPDLGLEVILQMASEAAFSKDRKKTAA